MVTISTSALIRKLALLMPYGKLFSTRDCLNFGTRAAVDQALYRLVNDGVITRIARGLFARIAGNTPIPTAVEIAEAKASAFHRRLYAHAEKALQQFRMHKPSKSKHQFATDGDTTSFLTIRGRIFLKHYAMRKLKLEDTKPGLAIRALWSVRLPDLMPDVLPDVVNYLNREEKQTLRHSCEIMPWYISDTAVSLMPINFKLAFDEKIKEAEKFMSRMSEIVATRKRIVLRTVDSHIIPAGSSYERISSGSASQKDGAGGDNDEEWKFDDDFERYKNMPNNEYDEAELE
jgi:hypothetical protein